MINKPEVTVAYLIMKRYIEKDDTSFFIDYNIESNIESISECCPSVNINIEVPMCEKTHTLITIEAIILVTMVIGRMENTALTSEW